MDKNKNTLGFIYEDEVKIEYDAHTKEWFKKHGDAETTLMRCEQCGLFYKPELGHVCHKAKEEHAKTKELRKIFSQITTSPTLYKYTVLIMGRPGPTGKTWLCDHFNAVGVRAIELSETINGDVSYDYDLNRVYIDRDNEIVTVILNKSII